MSSGTKSLKEHAVKTVSAQKFQISTVPAMDKNGCLKFTYAIINPEKGEILPKFFNTGILERDGRVIS